MKAANKKLEIAPPSLKLGVFNRATGAMSVASGLRHCHSTPLGDSDACVRLTLQAISDQKPCTFPWELGDCKSLELSSSAQRSEVFSTILEGDDLKKKRGLRERLQAVLEELGTNSLYHAYRAQSGLDAYSRKSAVKLDKNKAIKVEYRVDTKGVFLRMIDQGGSLTFKDIAEALGRCYRNGEAEIQSKEGGAGLGIFMIFENVTHLKIEVAPNKATIMSCWISDQKHHDPEYFSFNFFERSKG